LAERLLAQSEACRTAGRLISARSAYLRASNYFCTAYGAYGQALRRHQLTGARTSEKT
jgi:hypothetical protein